MDHRRPAGASCRVEAVTLTFEGKAGDPAFDLSGGNPYGQTQGHEVLSSSPLDFRVDTSTDGTTWRTVHQATNSPGGQVEVRCPTPVNARYVRLTGTKQANANPLGLNGFQVFGTAVAAVRLQPAGPPGAPTTARRRH